MSEDREISRGIVVNPARCGGVPTIRGTRIPAQMVANLAAGDSAMSAEAIMESYPSLSYADVVNAKLWAGRRAHEQTSS